MNEAFQNLFPQGGISVSNVTLNNGIKMPLLGFGTYQIKAPSKGERQDGH